MSLLSKKQLQHLQAAIGLLVCATLLCFPGGIPLFSAFPVLKALIAGFLALGLAHSLLKLGTLPAVMRIGVLLPIACSAPLTLLVLPHLFTVLWLIIPYALLLLSLRARLSSLPAFRFGCMIWLVLSLGSAGLLQLLNTQINQGLPLLPSHITIWLCILAIIPLGFASRPMLRPLAKAIALYQIWICLLCIGLYPLLWCAATSYKIPGEPGRNFHSLSPEPRFFLLPAEGIPDLSPSELRESPVQNGALITLNELGWRLTDVYIASTFSPQGEIPPKEMLRAMKLYGFLSGDSHGNFLPGESFAREAPKEMDPGFLPEFRDSMNQSVMGPAEISTNLKSNGNHEDSDEVIRVLEDLNWIREVPGDKKRYRLTSQARRPFANGLFPRQLLLMQQADPRMPMEMVQSEYVPRRELSPQEIFREFRKLETLGAAETRQVWKWNQHLDFLLHQELWKNSALQILCLILALLAGRSLTGQLSSGKHSLLLLVGALAILPLPHLSAILPALRIGLGLWLARNLYSLHGRETDRISLFAVCTFITAVLMPLAAGTPLVHHCAWVLIWTFPALICLGLAVRKT